MAELPRTHPLDGIADSFHTLSATLSFGVDAFPAMADVRLDPAAVPASGLPLPLTPNTWRPTADGVAVWLGPDEWLLTSARSTPEAWESGLRAAVGPHGGSAVDVSAQRVGLRVRGTSARDVLATGCAIDLHPRVFPRGSAAQTTLGLAGVVLLAMDDDGTDIGVLVRSSFARYLASWLLDAAQEHLPAPG